MVSRSQLYDVIMELYPFYVREYPQTRLVELLYARYNVGDVRLMTVQQLEDLIHLLRSVLPEEKEYA